MAALVLTGLLAAACSSPGSSSPGASTPSDGSEPTAWEWVLGQIGPNGEVSKELALQAFEVAIGDLPGVEPPPGPTGDIEEGTFAVFSIIQHWNDITEEQRAAADAYLNRGIEPDPSSAALPLAVIRLPGLPGPQPPSATHLEWISIKDEAVAFIQNKLVRDPVHTPTIEVEFNVQNEIQPGKDKAYGAISVPFNSDGGKTGDLARCVIKVNPNTQGYVGDQLRWLILHEVAHCFSWALRPIESPWLPWLEEGSATWIGYEFIGGSSSYDEEFWKQWLLEPDKRLYSRAYDAVGFFAHIEDSGANPWMLRDEMVKQSHILNGPYFVAVDAAPDRLLDEWGPGYLRDVNNIPRWETTGLGIPLNVQFETPVIDISDGSARTLTVNPLAATPARLGISADLVQIDATKEMHGRIRFPGGADYPINDLNGMSLCTRSDGCCPAADLQIPGGIAQVGLTGHLGGGVVIVTGQEAPCPTPTPEPTPTPKCLPGTWLIDHEDYDQYLKGLLGGLEDVRVEPSTGDLILQFGPQPSDGSPGPATTTARDFTSGFTWKAKDVLGGTFDIKVQSETVGTQQAGYLTPEPGVLQVVAAPSASGAPPAPAGELTTTYQSFINNKPVETTPLPPEVLLGLFSPPIGPGGNSLYTCVGNRLEISPQASGHTFIYHRA